MDVAVSEWRKMARSRSNLTGLEVRRSPQYGRLHEDWMGFFSSEESNITILLLVEKIRTGRCCRRRIICSSPENSAADAKPALDHSQHRRQYTAVVRNS